MKKRKLLSFLLVFATAVALSAGGSSSKAAEETTAEETEAEAEAGSDRYFCLLYTSPSPRDSH